MAYEYDRFEREDGGGSFLMGLLAGTVLGAGLGMLFAPKAGAELRNQLSSRPNRLRSTGERRLRAGVRRRSARWSTAAARPTTAPAGGATRGHRRRLDDRSAAPAARRLGRAPATAAYGAGGYGSDRG